MNFLSFFEISLDTANKFYSWGWKASLLGAVITLIGVTLLMWGTRVRDHDFESNMSQLTVDAANTNKRAQEIEHDNIALRKGLEKTIIEAGSEKQKLAKMQIEVATARKEQAEAEQSLVQLKDRLRPRSLSTEQREQLVKLLRSFIDSSQRNYVDLVYDAGDEEAFTYASQIQAVLESAGWKTHIPEQVFFTGTNYPMGIILQVFSAKNPPHHAAILQHAFSKIGIAIEGQESQQVPQTDIKLIVGKKP